MYLIAEINEKIQARQAVVVNAEEIIDIVEQDGAKKAAEQIDVVTTGTFADVVCPAFFSIFPTPRRKSKDAEGLAE